MKYYSFLILTLAATIILYSCRKDRHPYYPPPPYIDSTNDFIYPSYSHMQVGNYWIYQIFRIDSVSETPVNLYDSVYVEKDTIIRGNVYSKLMKPDAYGANTYHAEFRRDSLHYIVDDKNNILFSSKDFTTIFRSKYYSSNLISPVDSVGYVEYKMIDRDMDVFVPAGSFITSNYCEKWTMHPYFRQFAPLVRKINTRYSRTVGMVVEGFPFYATDPNIYERRLIRYKIIN